MSEGKCITYPVKPGHREELANWIAALGSGKPLLPTQIAFPPLQLTSVRQCGTGFVELR